VCRFTFTLTSLPSQRFPFCLAEIRSFSGYTPNGCCAANVSIVISSSSLHRDRSLLPGTVQALRPTFVGNECCRARSGNGALLHLFQHCKTSYGAAPGPAHHVPSRFLYGRLLNATHHWFSLLATLCAVRIVMPERTIPRIAIAGVLLGTACFFTQTAGVAALLALLLSLTGQIFHKDLLEHHPSGPSPLVTAFGVILAALNASLIAKVGRWQLWYFRSSIRGIT
jgi:hypothetical protein